MRSIFMVAAALVLMFAPVAHAGCVTGAAVGAVAGHMAGRHAAAGAVGGCAVGHHMARAKQRRQAGPRSVKPH